MPAQLRLLHGVLSVSHRAQHLASKPQQKAPQQLKALDRIQSLVGRAHTLPAAVRHRSTSVPALRTVLPSNGHSNCHFATIEPGLALA